MSYTDYSDYEAIGRGFGAGLGAFAGALLWMVFVAIAICIAAYIVYSLGTYKLAKAKGMNNAWLAWIPVANYYLIGKMANEDKFAIAMVILPVANWVLSSMDVSLLPSLCGIGSMVLMILCMIKIYKSIVPEQVALYTVLSVIVPFAQPCLFMSVAKKIGSQTKSATEVKVVDDAE